MPDDLWSSIQLQPSHELYDGVCLAGNLDVERYQNDSVQHETHRCNGCRDSCLCKVGGEA